MKKVLAVLLVGVVLASGCAQVVVKAPAGKKIVISSQPVTNPDQQKMVWYILWGLIPLGDNSTASLLANYTDGSEVAISTEASALDVIIGAVLGNFSITTRTVKTQKVK
ncbi:MAG: hypothetical protein N2314_07090 [Brevinematales bacterium]|nr:hypothetical protein [Brevinematales bacterium]